MAVDENWLTASSASAATAVRVSFPSPSGQLRPGAGYQIFSLWLRKTAGTPNPTVDVELWEKVGGTSAKVGSSLLSGTSITSTTGQQVDAPWNANSLAAISGGEVECRVVSTAGVGTLTEAIAPTALVGSLTNLSGAVTAIDESPDSPDANWLTATSATANTMAHVSFPTPSGTLVAGAGLQKARFYLRKTAGTPNPTADLKLYENGGAVSTLQAGASVTSTSGQLFEPTFNVNLLSDASGAGVELRVEGTAATGTEGLTPSATEASSNLASGSGTTILADVDDADPGNPDANWATASVATTATSGRWSFPTPTGRARIGAGLQKAQFYLRKTAGTPNPTCDLQLYENGSLVATLTSAQSITSTTGALYEPTFDADALTTKTMANVELGISSTVGTGRGALPAIPGSNFAGTAFSGTATGAQSIAVPTNTNGSGDLLLLVAHARASNSNGTVTSLTAGWTQLGGAGNVYGSGITKFAIGWRFADGSTTVSATFGGTGTVRFQGRVYRFTAANGFNSTPIQAISGPGGGSSGTSATFRSVTPTGINELAVHITTIGNSVNTVSSTGESGGDWAQAIAESSVTNATIDIQTSDQSGGGAISGGSVAISDGNVWTNLGFTLVPATININTVEVGAIGITAAVANTVEVGAIEFAPSYAGPVNTVEVGAINWLAAYTPGVSGALAATEAADAAAVAGKVVVQGSIAKAEAADALAAAGKVLVQGALASNEAADTAAAAGTVTSVTSGTLAATEAADTVSAAGEVIVRGALAAADSADAAAIGAKLLVQGDLAAADALDTAAAAGKVLVQGSLAATEATDQAQILGGAVVVTTGALDATEAADAAAFVAKLIVQGDAAATDAESADTAQGVGQVLVKGSVAATEPADAATFSGAGIVQGQLTAVESSDSAAFAGQVLIRGDLAATEAADTTIWNAGIGIIGTMAAAESADAAALTGIHVANGTLAASEARDTAGLTGRVIVQGAVAAVDPPDAASIPGRVLAQGTLVATDAQDAAIFVATIPRSEGSLAAIEAPDAAAAAGAVLVAGAAVATDAPDAAAVAGFVLIQGGLAVAEPPAADTFAGTGASTVRQVGIAAIVDAGAVASASIASAAGVTAGIADLTAEDFEDAA